MTTAEKLVEVLSLKVLLVGNYPADQQYSLLGFRSVLLQELEKRGVEVRLIQPEPVTIKVKNLLPGSSKWLGYIDKLLVFPGTLRRAAEWADIVHLCEHSSAVYVKHLRQKPHIVTCHDMMGIRAALGEMPEWQVGKTGQMYQQMILNGICKSQHVVCISETTQHDLERIAKIPVAKTTVIYNGFFYSFQRMSSQESAARLAEAGLTTDQPFLMHIGQNSPTKNRLGLLKIYNALRNTPSFRPMPLWMAGKPFTQELREYITAQNLQNDVRELVGLNNEQIRALYSRAKALIFPSLYEGFGMPVIEAQACGCPVFTSNRAPMNEIGGQAAVYFDPTQVEEAARIIASRLEVTDDIVSAGLKNVERFTTNNMIDGYMRTYQQVISGATRYD